MIVNKGEKVHVIYRRHFESEVRRHFAGEIIEVSETTVRLEGNAIIFDNANNQYVKKTESRTTIIDLAESGYITNIIPREVNINELKYVLDNDMRLTLTDGKKFCLDINEFGANR
jgi:hypothetical protein